MADAKSSQTAPVRQTRAGEDTTFINAMDYEILRLRGAYRGLQMVMEDCIERTPADDPLSDDLEMMAVLSWHLGDVIDSMKAAQQVRVKAIIGQREAA